MANSFCRFAATSTDTGEPVANVVENCSVHETDHMIRSCKHLFLKEIKNGKCWSNPLIWTTMPLPFSTLYDYYSNDHGPSSYSSSKESDFGLVLKEDFLVVDSNVKSTGLCEDRAAPNNKHHIVFQSKSFRVHRNRRIWRERTKIIFRASQATVRPICCTACYTPFDRPTHWELVCKNFPF